MCTILSIRDNPCQCILCGNSHVDRSGSILVYIRLLAALVPGTDDVVPGSRYFYKAVCFYLIWQYASSGGCICRSAHHKVMYTLGYSQRDTPHLILVGPGASVCSKDQ